jgi:tetratricopeptide (TPR) repeat protein
MEAFDRAEQLAREVGSTRTRSLVSSFRSLLHTQRGESERALELGKQALALAPDPVSSMTAALGLAQAQMVGGRYDEAVAVLSNLVLALKASNLGGLLGLALSLLAEAHLQRGDLQLATAMSDDAQGLLTKGEAPRIEGSALRVSSLCKAAAGRYGEARSCLREALDLLEASRAGYDLAQAHLAGAEIAIAEGEESAAREALLRAAALFDELELRGHAERAAERATPEALRREILARPVLARAF